MAIFSRHSDLDNPEYQSDTGGLTPITLALLNYPFLPKFMFDSANFADSADFAGKKFNKNCS